MFLNSDIIHPIHTLSAKQDMSFYVFARYATDLTTKFKCNLCLQQRSIISCCLLIFLYIKLSVICSIDVISSLLHNFSFLSLFFFFLVIVVCLKIATDSSIRINDAHSTSTLFLEL